MAELIAAPGAATEQLSRPLPIGAFPLPFGYLLLPEHESTASVRTGLLLGRLDEWAALAALEGWRGRTDRC